MSWITCCESFPSWFVFVSRLRHPSPPPSHPTSVLPTMYSKPAVQNYADFNPQSMVFSKPRRMEKTGGTVIGCPMRITFPIMNCWGMQPKTDMNTNVAKPGEYVLTLQFSDSPSDEEAAFLEKMKQIEERFFAAIQENSMAWLGKPSISKELLENIAGAFLKYPPLVAGAPAGSERNYSKPPKLELKVNLNQRTGKFDVCVFDLDCSTLFDPKMADPLVDVEEHLRPEFTGAVNAKTGLPSSMPFPIKGALECAGIWIISNRNVYMTFKLDQVMVIDRAGNAGPAECALTPMANASSSTTEMLRSAALAAAAAEEEEAAEMSNEEDAPLSDGEGEEEVEIVEEDEDPVAPEEESVPEPDPEPPVVVEVAAVGTKRPATKPAGEKAAKKTTKASKA